MVDFIEKSSSNNLWKSGFQLGDWLYFRSVDDMNGETATTNRFYIAQCFWAHSTQLLINTAKLLGVENDVERYNARLQTIKEAFLNEYITPNRQFVSGTQTAYLLALEFDMLPENMRQTTADKLVQDIIAHNYHLSTGFLGTPYICHVLTRYGYNAVAYRLLLQQTYPSWLYPVTMGATTIWERWDGIKPDGSFQGFMMNSLNHYSYGAVGDWMYRVVAGIEPLEPGYKRIKIAPQPDSSLQFANASYQSMYGEIVSGWKRKNDTIEVQVKIPANTTAEIHLQGKLVQKSPQAYPVISEEQHETIIKVGSGSYSFYYTEAGLK